LSLVIRPLGRSDAPQEKVLRAFLNKIPNTLPTSVGDPYSVRNEYLEAYCTLGLLFDNASPFEIDSAYGPIEIVCCRLIHLVVFHCFSFSGYLFGKIAQDDDCW
jgi:hypothetical protein